jgi:ABC-type transporter Mla subunit MlaD
VNNDFVNKALESAKSLQQSVTEAVSKGAEQAKPIVADALAKAQDLQKQIVDQAPHVGEAAQQNLQAAQGHLATFISAAGEVLAKGVEGAQAGLTPLAENARQAIHVAAKSVTEATAPKPPVPPAS